MTIPPILTPQIIFLLIKKKMNTIDTVEAKQILKNNYLFQNLIKKWIFCHVFLTYFYKCSEDIHHNILMPKRIFTLFSILSFYLSKGFTFLKHVLTRRWILRRYEIWNILQSYCPCKTQSFHLTWLNLKICIKF